MESRYVQISRELTCHFHAMPVPREHGESYMFELKNIRHSSENNILKLCFLMLFDFNKNRTKFFH